MTQIHRILCPIPFALKTVNCYYIADSAPTLIDTGVDHGGNLEIIAQAIQQAGGSLKGLKRIILTHAHTDHLGLAGRLAEISGAEIHIHRREEPKIICRRSGKNDAYMESFHGFLRSAGVPEALSAEMMGVFHRRLDELVRPIDHVNLLEGGEIFAFDDFELQVLHTPGHTSGSISLYHSRRNELISGDTLLRKITPNPVAEIQLPEEDPDYRSIPRYLESLHRIAPLSTGCILPGHGSAFQTGTERIGALAAHIDARKKTVERLMQKNRLDNRGGLTLYQLACIMFPRLEGLDVFLGLSEAYAYLQIFESEGRIERPGKPDTPSFLLKDPGSMPPVS